MGRIIAQLPCKEEFFKSKKKKKKSDIRKEGQNKNIMVSCPYECMRVIPQSRQY